MAHSAASRIGILRSKVFGGAGFENGYEDFWRRAEVTTVARNFRRVMFAFDCA
jgi:hypothetical protein